MNNEKFNFDEASSELPTTNEENMSMRPPDEGDDPPYEPPYEPPTGDQFSPTGWLDSADSGNVSGWSYDPDNSSASNDVHIYIGGPAGGGGVGYAVTANQSRPDVNAAFGIGGDHGFSFQVPAQYADGQQYPVYAYGIDTGANSPSLLQGCPKYFVINPPPPSVELNQISPIAGSVAGGLSVTLTGNGFQSGAAVYFGSTPATQVTVESGQVIHAVLPAAANAGSVSVSVINPDGSSAAVHGGFTYVSTEAGQQAEVVGISPLTVLENTQSELTIRGRNLIQAYNSGVFALRGPSRCHITFVNVTTSHDAATGLDTIKVLANIQCSPVLQPLERLAIQVLASTRPEAANDGVVQTSKQMFTVLPKSVPVPLAYTSSLTPNQPNLVMVSGRNLNGYQLSLDNGAEVSLQKSSDNFVSGVVQLPENHDTSQPLQLSMKNANGVEVNSFAMEVAPLMQASQPSEYMALAAPQDAMDVSFTEIPNQQFFGPTENDNSVFSMNNIGWGGIFNWGSYEITILDLTIILPIVNEVHLIPFFDGGGDDLDSPILAEVGKIFRLRGAGLLVAYRVEVQIHIRVALIIGFYTYIWSSWGYFNEFPEYGWGIGSVVIGVRVDIEVLFFLSFLMALVKPNGQLQILVSANLTAGIDFSIDGNGHLHFDPEFTHSVNVIGINPVPNNPTPCGNKFELLPQNGLAAVPDALGFAAQYAVHEAGDCCLPWDFNVELKRFTSTGQPEVVQTGFQTNYCLTAVQPPSIDVELSLAYKDDSNNIVTVTNIYRDEPDSPKPRNYFLAGRFSITSGNLPNNFTARVKLDKASLIVNGIEISSRTTGANLPFPSGTFGAIYDKSSARLLSQFFDATGKLIDSSATYGATFNNNGTNWIAFSNADLIPNRVESAGKFVIPGPEVTAHINGNNPRPFVIKLAFKELQIIDSNNNQTPSDLTTKLLESKITNNETFEEYFRVFAEVRNLMETQVGRSGTGTLGTFTKAFLTSLPQSGSVSSVILKTEGKKLWDLGCNFVQGGKIDDRMLYFSRLEAIAVLRDVNNRNGLQTLSQDELNIFEYSSRGLETITGDDAKVEFSLSDKKKVLLTGFDPFLLPDYGLVSNPSGIAALSFNNNSTEFPNAEVKTAVFPVRFADFGNNTKGIIEKVMEDAVKNTSLIVTCSRGLFNYDVERFATRYRTKGVYDNLRVKSATDNPSEYTGNPSVFYIESTLPYTSVISDTKKQTFDGPTGSGTTPLSMNQSYSQANKNRPYPSPFSDPFSYTKDTNPSDLPDSNEEMIEGSGQNYLSNEIFYRTAKVRENNRKDLPTGHLHLPIIDFSTITNVQNQGGYVINGVKEILKEFMNYALEMVFPETQINSGGVSKISTLNNFTSPRMQSVPAIDIVSVEISPPNLQPNFQVVTALPINNIAAGASKDIEIKFIPTEVKDYVAIAKLKDSNGVTLFTISLKGKGVIAQPKITSFSPSSGLDGTIVTILGENFSGVTDVRIGDSIYFDVISPTRVDAYISQNAFTSFIEVVTTAGTATSSTVFRVFRTPPHGPNDPSYE